MLYKEDIEFDLCFIQEFSFDLCFIKKILNLIYAL